MNELLVLGLQGSDYLDLAKVIEVWRPDTANELRNYPERIQSDRHLVAVLDDQIVGWLKGNHKSGAWSNIGGNFPEGWVCSYVSEIFTAGDVRQRGVGAALLRKFEDDARRVGNTLIVVFPDKAEVDELEIFYRKCGFEWGPAKSQYEEKSHVMVKWLN